MKGEFRQGKIEMKEAPARQSHFHSSSSRTLATQDATLLSGELSVAADL